MSTPEASALMRAQAGTISRAQALATGVSDRQLDRLVSNGQWHRLLLGVYLHAGAELTWAAWAHAFALAAGPGAALVAASGAGLRGLVPAALPVTLAVPPGRRPRVRHDHLRLLRLDLPDDDRVTIQGLPTTTRLRTAVDLAHLVPPTQAQPVIDRMLVLDQIVLDDLVAAVEASRRVGSAQARRLVASAQDLAAAESERAVRRLLRAAGFCDWVPNYAIALGGRVRKLDLANLRYRIGIEVKGWTFHAKGDRGASDDARVADLQLESWLVIPVGWLALQTEPQAFVERVRRAFALQRRRGVA